MTKTYQNKSRQRLGFTLIELLVVVSILLILTSLLVPRLRTVTQERNIRETARVVGSMFSQASQRAVVDGISGVVLLRNSNFVEDSTGYLYASSQIGLLRRVPNFTGDQATDMATAVSPGIVSVPKPLEQDDLEIILSGDSVSFGTSSTLYQITTVVDGGTTLNLSLKGLDGGTWQSYLPDPGSFDPTAPRPYVIHRLPRLLRSSLTDLPNGFIVDLRFSGCVTVDNVVPNPNAFNVIERAPTENTATVSFSDSDVILLIDDQGKFDRLLLTQNQDTSGTSIPTQVLTRVPQGPFYAFVTPAETDTTFNSLNKDTNLWVSLSNTSGAVNVGYNVAQVNDANIGAARSDATRGSAAQ